MYVDIQNLETGELETLHDVESCSYDGIEFCVQFKTGHKYSSIEEILNKLPRTEELNFYFKGVSAWDYALYKEGHTWANGHEIKFREIGPTRVLCVMRNARVMAVSWE